MHCNNNKNKSAHRFQNEVTFSGAGVHTGAPVPSLTMMVDLVELWFYLLRPAMKTANFFDHQKIYISYFRTRRTHASEISICVRRCVCVCMRA